MPRIKIERKKFFMLGPFLFEFTTMGDENPDHLSNLFCSVDFKLFEEVCVY
jgi:hypothetical protein